MHRRFLPYLRPHARRFAWAVLAMCVVAAFNGGAVLLLKPIVDRIFIARDLSMLWLAVVGVPLLVAGKTVASYVQNYLMSWIGQTVTQKIREDLFRLLLELPVDFYDRRHSSEVFSRAAGDLTMVQSALVSVPLYLIRDSMTLVVLTASLFYLDWRFALISLAGAPLTLVALIILSRKMRLASLQSQGMMERLTDRFEELLRGISIIKAYNHEDRFFSRFKDENASFFSLVMRYLRATALAAPLMELCGAVGVAALLYFGGTAVIAERMTPGAFFSFLGAFFSAYAPIKNLARTNSELQRALASGERIFELLDQKPDPSARPGSPFPGLGSGLRLDAVSFYYPGAADPALEGVSFTLAKGERLALVGPAGSGKTTLLRLILLLHQPTSGRLLFDGTDAFLLDPRCVRARTGFVARKTMIFNDTVLGNIALGDGAATLEAVGRAARAAGLADWAASLPEGYRTMLGAEGPSLSALTRQRIALARVALRDPELLILDEAAAGLDGAAEREFLRTLEPLLAGRTVICAGHRLFSALSIPRVLSLDRGRLADADAGTALALEAA